MELSNLINAIGWTLINSLWQGLFILLILAIAMVIINPKYSQVRSLIAYACLLFVFAASIRTFSDLYTTVEKPSTKMSEAITSAESDFVLFHQNLENKKINANTSISTWDRIISFTSSYGSKNINYIVALWLIGISILTIKMLGGYFYMRRMKTKNVIPVEFKWHKLVGDISEKLGLIRHVKIFESTIINFPTVIGYFKPVILMPIGSLAGMPYDQVEMILAHELAHVKRTDYLLNLIQSFLEIIYFFNPSVWIISKIIRNEREYACDDLALSINKDVTVLANALLTVNKNRLDKPTVALSALGTKNSLLGRIKRMVHKNNKQTNYQKKFMVSGILIIALFTVTMLACSSSTDSYNSQSSMKSRSAGFLTSSNDVEKPESYSEAEKKSQIVDIKNIDETEDITLIEYDNGKNGKRKFNFHKDNVHWKGIVENGKLINLYKNGDRIPENELESHEGFVFNTLDEIDDALADIDIDMDDLKQDLTKLQEDLKDMKIDIDMDEINEIEKHFNSDEFKKEMRELKESLKDIKIDIDFEHLREIGEHFNSEEFKHEMDNVKAELEKLHDLKIDFDLDESFKESMKELKEGLKDFKIDMSDIDIDLSDLKIDLSELKVEMKKLKGFMKEMKSDLVSEGYIEDNDNDFDLELDEYEITVNDKKLPDHLHKRYLKMYKKHYGKDLEENFVIHN